MRNLCFVFVTVILLVLSVGPAYSGGFSEGITLFSTGFDSNEGWVEGGVTVAPNPAVGSWFSYYAYSGQTKPAQIDLSGNGMQFEATPSSGDGLLFSNRIGVPWGQQASMDGAVSGWEGNEGPIFEVTVDMRVVGNYGVVAVKNSTTDTSNAVILGAVLTAGYDIGYLTSGGWVFPESGYGKAPVDYWDTVRIVLDTATQTYNAYIGATTICENIPYAKTYGDSVFRSVMFTLGGVGRAYWDSLRVAAKLPRPDFCGDDNTVYLPGDLNKDCEVSFEDFAVLAAEWLACTDPQNPACEAWIQP